MIVTILIRAELADPFRCARIGSDLSVLDAREERRLLDVVLMTMQSGIARIIHERMNNATASRCFIRFASKAG